MFKRLKCLLKGHNYNSLNYTNDYADTSIKTYTQLVCEKCDKVKLEIRKISNVDVIYKRWTELAGVANGKKTPNGYSLYSKSSDDEMKNLLKSSHKLNLKKMKVDVKSFVSADEALVAQEEKGKNNG